MINRHIVALLTVLVLVTSSAFPDVVPGRWEKVDGLKPGDEILIEIESGEKEEVAFVSSTPDAIVVAGQVGGRRTLPKNAVVRVSRLKKSMNGELLGTAIGAGAGVATGLAIGSQFDETFFARADLMALTCGSIGAVTGLLIGHAVSHPARQETLYRKQGTVEAP